MSNCFSGNRTLTYLHLFLQSGNDSGYPDNLIAAVNSLSQVIFPSYFARGNFMHGSEWTLWWTVELDPNGGAEVAHF